MRQVKKSAIILMAIFLAACVTNTPEKTSSVSNDYCKIYVPIFDHPKDTIGTRDQVRDRNGRYECVCMKNCPVAKVIKTPSPLGTVPAKVTP